ncbi:uncharacterized protein LOC115922370 [Strongylocentrotus purpuratus]|uniref:Apple domain-containing protein n=1 Tax=Strongylocentrotus purpuratus TaxID=7668 RepID=A0A7M7NIY4_STRPU|nr:uncharacterized protein LOC115922370 [Strongylocentrotus purpuratus]
MGFKSGRGSESGVGVRLRVGVGVEVVMVVGMGVEMGMGMEVGVGVGVGVGMGVGMGVRMGMGVRTTPTKSAGFFSVAKDNEGRPLIGHCLTDHVMKTVPARTKLRCAAECIHEVGCKSINYKDGVCELNEETRASVLSSYFSQYDGCSYYELI